ncbi:LysE family translocator [Actinobacteria bacterium YIM 96077]|uniref:LysE family translocator n=1 Tax=Phytoactinopolyspora halophila TaxID=1981511 RepID=A0A329R4Y6_9ACTN|nr:LysE family translocator [Phytoactinopolyspora halophila]AYY12174.1 LysE family translocator [Actinobacteria bacterium YIM 96077]RAW18592.1 LysE family translocator [Phytoactinopolyspora halophila]
MPGTSSLLTFATAAVVLIAIPGPTVLFVVSRALAYGRRAALLTVVGGAVGSFALAVAVAVGIGAIVRTSALAFTIVKMAGAAYLVYLGVRAFRQRHALHSAFNADTSVVSDRRTWWEGFVVSVTNPKSAVFFAAVLPQFVEPQAGSPALQMLTFGAIFTLIALACDSVWGVTAGAVRAWFARSARRLELVGGAAGLTMVGLGVGLALTGRKD